MSGFQSIASDAWKHVQRWDKRSKFRTSFEFMDSFVFKQQVLFRVYIRSMTYDLMAQYPKGWTSDQNLVCEHRPGHFCSFYYFEE